MPFRMTPIASVPAKYTHIPNQRNVCRARYNRTSCRNSLLKSRKSVVHFRQIPNRKHPAATPSMPKLRYHSPAQVILRPPVAPPISSPPSRIVTKPSPYFSLSALIIVGRGFIAATNVLPMKRSSRIESIIHPRSLTSGNPVNSISEVWRCPFALMP